MQGLVITCPYCHKEIHLTEAITHEVREGLRRELGAETQKREQEIARRELALSDKEKGLETLRKSLEDQFAEKIRIEKARLEKEAKSRAQEAIAVELGDLHEQVKEKEGKLLDFQKAELDLRKRLREAEEAKQVSELEMARRLDEERKKIEETASSRLMEEHRLKDLEKEKQLADMRKQIEELKRKAEQGSQQAQGEVLELELEDILKANFPHDQIEPVPKGMRGADVLQKVHNQSGQYCGTIIWESKHTKAWNDDWLEKLKDDQREAKAEVAALLTKALPKEISNFAYVNGIWVTNSTSMVGLATALRINLIQVTTTKLAAVGKNEKMEILYGYLAGPEFRQRVEAIVEAFTTMKEDLDQEKRAMTRIWSKREKQIERVISNTIGMYGDLQGIIGASLPQIERLDLNALAAETASD
ncbi:MAG TPA: DUF2130 domain-containing protein [Proteobacteria bacterium]|nr:DUF2130 domain-containing protein [Pseudomonadota bacterium]